jgi:hypothetical protein
LLCSTKPSKAGGTGIFAGADAPVSIAPRSDPGVEAGRYRSPVRHILVDQFQDMAAGGTRLIRR